MVENRVNPSKNLFGMVDSRLRPLFDWFTGLPPEEAEAFRADILATVMLKPAGLLLSSIGILLMSMAAMAITEARWAFAWLVFDTVALTLRAIPTFFYLWRGTRMPGCVARLLICGMLVIGLVFGIGCAACMMVLKRPIAVIATASMIGLVAGLSTRWAALPRLAIPAIMLIAAPFCWAVATAGDGKFQAAALQFMVVVGATAALTLQNNRTLVALFRAERRNRELASTDALTALPNRAGLIARLDRLRGDPDAATSEIASLFVDLDGFKAINDGHGHAVGDRVLIEIAHRLRRTASPHFACRLGGDEFVVLIEVADRTNATFVARRIADEIGQPIEGCTHMPLRVTASVGIAFSAVAGRDTDSILSDADRALYIAKGAGGGQHAIDEPKRATA